MYSQRIEQVSIPKNKSYVDDSGLFAEILVTLELSLSLVVHEFVGSFIFQTNYLNSLRVK